MTEKDKKNERQEDGHGAKSYIKKSIAAKIKRRRKETRDIREVKLKSASFTTIVVKPHVLITCDESGCQ